MISRLPLLTKNYQLLSTGSKGVKSHILKHRIKLNFPINMNFISIFI